LAARAVRVGPATGDGAEVTGGGDGNAAVVVVGGVVGRTTTRTTGAGTLAVLADVGDAAIVVGTVGSAIAVAKPMAPPALRPKATARLRGAA